MRLFIFNKAGDSNSGNIGLNDKEAIIDDQNDAAP